MLTNAANAASISDPSNLSLGRACEIQQAERQFDFVPLSVDNVMTTTPSFSETSFLSNIRSPVLKQWCTSGILQRQHASGVSHLQFSKTVDLSALEYDVDEDDNGNLTLVEALKKRALLQKKMVPPEGDS